MSLALGVNPGYFFDGVDTAQQVVSCGTFDTDQTENIIYKNLAQSMEHPIFSLLYVILKPGLNEGCLFQHPGQEFLYVLEGQLTVQIGVEKFVLNPSDSIMFNSSKYHYWYNYTEKNVKFLCVGYDEK